MTMRTSLIVLGAAGAMLLANPIPGLAQGLYVDTPVVQFGFGAPWYGYGYRGYPAYGYYRDDRAFAYVPSYRTHRGWRRGVSPYERPSMRWDPYGRRWDGGN
jgi:hypothetical protein